MTSRTGLFAAFATKHNISPVQCIALPTVFEDAARKCQLSVEQLMDQCEANDALAAHMAELINSIPVAEEFAKEAALLDTVKAAWDEKGL